MERRRRENRAEAPWLGSGHAPIAVTDGDDDAVRSHDGVGAAKPVRLAPGAGIRFRKARSSFLVKEHHLAALAAKMAGAAEVEQGLDGFRADAALLHAGAGVMGEGLHATTPGLRPPAGPAKRRCR